MKMLLKMSKCYHTNEKDIKMLSNMSKIKILFHLNKT